MGLLALLLLSGCRTEDSGLPNGQTGFDYILCKRDAEITAVRPDFDSASANPCAGSVILQGISYECAPTETVERKREKFLEDLRIGGKNYCQEFCRKRSTATTKCRGVFIEPEKCGFTVPTRNAESFGREQAKCNPKCAGIAFAYCSIYAADYLRVEESSFTGKRPNCLCERVK